jgi:hypothetical protein
MTDTERATDRAGRWSSVIVHPRSVPASRFVARLAAYEVEAGRSRLARSRTAAALTGAAIATRHALGGRRPDPAVDRLLDALHADWPLPSLPPERDGMSVVVLERSAARTVFVFATDSTPLLVAKFGDVATEEAALTRAQPAGVTPKPLGRVADAFVQEGIPGQPVPLPLVSPAEVLHLRWSAPFRSLARAVVKLSETTATRSAPAELGPSVALALADDIGAAAKAAACDAERIPVSVLRHGDLSGQNWLVVDDRVTGIIDWEAAVDSGVPGFDVLHAAVSWFEHVLIRSKATDAAIASGFEAAWDRSPFFAGARRATIDAAAAAGVPAPMHESLVVAFFVRRLGRRLRFGPDDRRTVLARRMLDAVCR